MLSADPALQGKRRVKQRLPIKSSSNVCCKCHPDGLPQSTLLIAFLKCFPSLLSVSHFSISISGEGPGGAVGPPIITYASTGPPPWGSYEPTVRRPEKSLRKFTVTDVKMPPRGHLKSQKNGRQVGRNTVRTLPPKKTMKRYQNGPAEPSKI